MSLNESTVEDAAHEWFGELGYAIGHGPHLAPKEPAAERDSFGDVVLAGRLREAIWRLNPAIPEDARDEALRKVLRVATPSLTQTNRAFHRMLRDGVPVEYPWDDGSIAGDHVRLVDFDDCAANDWLAVNQFTVIEGQHNRRPDIVVFINATAIRPICRRRPSKPCSPGRNASPCCSTAPATKALTNELLALCTPVKSMTIVSLMSTYGSSLPRRYS